VAIDAGRPRPVPGAAGTATHRIAFLLLALAALAVGTGAGAGSTTRSHDPALVGSRSVGDPFYPTLGNGGYDVEAYDLDLTWRVPDAAHPVGLVEGRVIVELRSTQALDELSLDLSRGNTRVEQVRVDGRAAAHRSDPLGRKLIVGLDVPAPEGTGLRLEVGWTATPQGVHRLGEGIPLTGPGSDVLRDARGFLSDGDSGFLLAAQPNGAHTLFPSNDHPTDKALVSVRLTAPAGMLGVATGERVEQVAHDDGSTTTTWRSDAPVATHVLALGVGRVMLIESDMPGGPHLRSVVPRALAPLASHRLDDIDEAVRWMQEELGRPYPFGSVGVQLALPGATGAVLEGQTLVLAGAGVLVSRATDCAWTGLLVHEVAHQWFGDAVSLVRWDQKWLSEGHATWYQRRWEAASGCDPLGFDGRMALIARRAQAVRDRGGPPDRPKGPGSAYDATVYDQGALVLEALRREVGDQTFRDIEGAWVDRYRDASASTDDFIDLASAVAARDLRPFLEAWLRSDEAPRSLLRPDPSPSPGP
jgi:aminopeptidase N